MLFIEQFDLFSGCGGSYSSSFGKYAIQSPGYPEHYANDSFCKYELRGSILGFGIRLEFKTFDLEDSEGCQNDNFTIYEGRITNSSATETRCGTVNGDFISQSQYVTVVFKSNSHLSRKGFSVNVGCKYHITMLLSWPKVCHGVFVNNVFSVKILNPTLLPILFSLGRFRSTFHADSEFRCYCLKLCSTLL